MSDYDEVRSEVNPDEVVITDFLEDIRDLYAGEDRDVVINGAVGTLMAFTIEDLSELDLYDMDTHEDILENLTNVMARSYARCMGLNFQIDGYLKLTPIESPVSSKTVN